MGKMKITGKHIDKIQKNHPIKSKAQLKAILTMWLSIDGVTTIGNLKETKGVAPLIWVEIGSKVYNIHSDTNKDGVKTFLKNEKENSLWIVINTDSGIKSKVTNNKDKSPIKGFYMYVYE